jgi:hypothetical protein
MSTDTNKELDIGSPDTEVSVKKMFGIDSDLMIPAFKNQMIMFLKLMKIIFLIKIQL